MNNPQINIEGRQPQMLVDIRNFIQAGNNITHILNVKVSNQVSKETGDRIRQQLYSTIANRNIQLLINGVQVAITWITTALQTSAYYYADIPMFTDVVVESHTQMLLTQTLGAMGAAHPAWFNPNTGVVFMITKPQAQPPQAIPPQIVQVPPQIPPPQQLDSGDEDD